MADLAINELTLFLKYFLTHWGSIYYTHVYIDSEVIVIYIKSIQWTNCYLLYINIYILIYFTS